MFLRIVIFCILTMSLFKSYAQVSYEGSKIISVKLGARIDRVENIKSDWRINLKSFVASSNKSSISDKELEKLKRENNLRTDNLNKSRLSSLDPSMNINFEGNKGEGSVRPDNTIAVSTNGFVISSINSNLIFTSSAGKTLKSLSLGDFFSDLKLGGNFFDPKVLFDYEENKFIIVCLSGSNSDISHVVVGFSETEDPLGRWNTYKIVGDVKDEGVWFDYPNIAVNNEDLFVTGNMFTNENSFRYSTVLQIDKDGGYNGNSINYKHYTKMKEKTTGQNLFNITPCPKGWNYNLNENMNFLTNDNRGSNVILLCSINKKTEDNPSFVVGDAVFTNQYNVAPNASQKNSTVPLKTGDCRIMYGIDLNNIIHFVFNSGINGFASITYGRYNLNNNIINTSVYSEPDMHLGYPSIAAFGNNETESKVLINFLRSNSDIYAELAAVVCDGTENNFTWSNSVLIKDGLGIVSAITEDGAARWGDYSAAFRRFWNDKAEVWISGCIGRSTFGSWTAQLLSQDENGKRENFNDFTTDKSVINPGDTITISYFGDSINYNSIAWFVEGGTLIASDSNSVTLKYDTLGFYDVQMNAEFKNDSLSLFKNKYISVVPKVFVPVANFYADRTTAYIGDTIRFFDQSTNETEVWKWTFSNGSPTTSSDQNPKIVYNKKGQFNVVLVSKNSAGEDVEVKQKYITITEKPVIPVADFMADKTEIIPGDTIVFSNTSLNNAKSLQWSFTGADVDTSAQLNPSIVYSVIGTYPVTLIASNEAGSDTITKLDYITVGTSSTKSENLVVQYKMYPNPVTNEDFSLEFDLNQNRNLVFELYNSDGRLIKYMLEKVAKIGKNLFTFNAQMLNSGIYVLKVYDKKTLLAQSFKIIIK